MMLLQFLWELLSSRTAIGLYVLVVLALIIWLVVAVLRADSSRVQVVAPEGEGDGNGKGTGSKGGTSRPGEPERADGESRFFMLAKTDEIMRK